MSAQKVNCFSPCRCNEMAMLVSHVSKLSCYFCTKLSSCETLSACLCPVVQAGSGQHCPGDAGQWKWAPERASNQGGSAYSRRAELLGVSFILC